MLANTGVVRWGLVGAGSVCEVRCGFDQKELKLPTLREYGEI